jgi:hypothetical protein
MLRDIASEQHIESLYSKYGINNEKIEEALDGHRTTGLNLAKVWVAPWNNFTRRCFPTTGLSEINKGEQFFVLQGEALHIFQWQALQIFQ